MGEVARSNYKGSESLARKGELCTEEEYRGNSPGTTRRRDVSNEEKRLINQLREEGLTPPEIARRLCRSRSCIYRHLYQGGKHPRWTDEDNQVLVDGYLANLPTREIAAKLGRSPTAIRAAWWRHKKRIHEDPKKQYTMSMISLALKAVRKADIYREMEEL